MAKAICIMGESGSGKTTAMRNLDPATTFYVDCDKKGCHGRDGGRILTKRTKTTFAQTSRSRRSIF